MIEIGAEEFAELVAEAIDGLPEQLARVMDNVALFIDDDSPPGRLLGLYQGIPLTKRSGYGEYPSVPDRITIFRQTVCAVCRDEAQVREQVRTTVLHEIAHHFGISDARLHELGWA